MAAGRNEEGTGIPGMACPLVGGLMHHGDWDVTLKPELAESILYMLMLPSRQLFID